MANEAEDMSSWTNLLHSSSKLVEQAAPSAQFPPLQRNLDQLEALSKKLKSKTLRTERLLAREGLNAEQLARDLKSFELKTTFEDVFPAEATSVEEYLQQTTFEDVFPAEATSVEEYLQQVVIENMTTCEDDTFHGFTIEDNLDLVNEYKVLKGKHDMLIKRDEVFQRIIIYLYSENATQKKKVELLENEIKELKSQDVAKELSKRSMEEVEDENAKLKVKTLEQKKEINMLGSKVHRLQSEIKQSEENHQSEVKLLETQLNQQKEFVLSADVKNIIDKIKEANNEMISYMEKAHNLEKSAIRMDGENKVRILLELQKKVQDLNAQN